MINLSNIKSANIVWYSKIIKENSFEVFEIPETIIYPSFSENSCFIAISDKNINFIDDAYQEKVDFDKFYKVFNDAVFFNGELLKGASNLRILTKNKFIHFFELVKKNRITTLVNFCKSNGILYDERKLEAVSTNSDQFLLISTCKCCGLPEDESDFVWISFEDGEWWVRMWIHNSGNMWVAQFIL